MTFYSADEVAPQQVSDKVTRRLVTGEKLMLAIHEVGGGTVVDTHHHESEQILYVLSGAIRFRLGEEEREMAPGDFVVVSSNAEHSAQALADARVLEVFSPIRKEWL